jgi:F-type H+-transporting ATPase subunit b
LNRLAALAVAVTLSGILGLAQQEAQEQVQREQEIHGAEKAAERAHAEGTADHGDETQIWWKWANFAIFAGVLGYMARKYGSAFFTGRTAEIRRGIADAEQMKAQADARMAEVETRLANLGAEIAVLRETATREQSAEAGPIHDETVSELAKIRANAEQEIERAGKAARLELKRYTAELALELAEWKIRQRMTPETQETLVRNFVQKLPQPTAAHNP